ncbi:hypothetical protein G3I23_08785 [Streptomyces sp. SID10115]|uniref:hypothetical protein n=1 Tax=Streptomyces sp. SID339 TaxID=2706080 RepID=UPI0013C7B91B|nr:hypothetical protein [Streptomyces sp. SID339]NDZ85661.1 hypothetical protein [Streptomyces sp. SID10115]
MAVDLPVQGVDLLIRGLGLLVQVADLQADRGEVGLDDPELAVVLLSDLFETPGQGSKLAVSDGASGTRHSCQINKTADKRTPTIARLCPCPVCVLPLSGCGPG